MKLQTSFRVTESVWCNYQPRTATPNYGQVALEWFFSGLNKLTVMEQKMVQTIFQFNPRSNPISTGGRGGVIFTPPKAFLPDFLNYNQYFYHLVEMVLKGHRDMKLFQPTM